MKAKVKSKKAKTTWVIASDTAREVTPDFGYMRLLPPASRNRASKMPFVILADLE